MDSFNIRLFLADDGFNAILFKDCPPSLSLSDFNKVLINLIEVHHSHIKLLASLKGFGGAVNLADKLSSTDQLQKFLVPQPVSSKLTSSSVTEFAILLINTSIRDEASLEEAKRASLSFDNFGKPFKVINLSDLAAARALPPLKPSRKPSSALISQRKYEEVPVSGRLDDEGIKNFDFSTLLRLSSLSTESKQILEGLDIPQLQTFEQMIFVNFQKAKSLYRQFKGLTGDCRAEIDLQQELDSTVQLVNKFLPRPTTHKEVDSDSKHDALVQSFEKTVEFAKQHLVLYDEGLKHLKTSLLHPKLRTESKKYLIDIYYKEEQMAHFKHSLQHKLANLKDEVSSHLSVVGSCLYSPHLFDDENFKALRFNEDQLAYFKKKLEAEKEQNDPLVFSMLQDILDNLKNFHGHLASLNLCRENVEMHQAKLNQAVEYFKDPAKFKLMLEGHHAYFKKMEQHSTDLRDKMVADLLNFRRSLSKEVLRLKPRCFPDGASSSNSSERSKKRSEELIEKLAVLQKDYKYLAKPSMFSKAFAEALPEMKRRTLFRRGLNYYVANLKQIIDQEHKCREKFHQQHFQYLPSNFYSQLVDKVPVLHLEGQSSELGLPDLTDSSDIVCDTDPFAVFGTASADKMNTAKPFEQEIEVLSEQVDMLKIQVSSRDRSILERQSQLREKDKELSELREQLEQLNRQVADITQNQEFSVQVNEDKLRMKQKELEAVLREKKCKNCAICLEGLNTTHADSIDLITDLNKKLNSKQVEAERLLESFNKQSKLLAEVSQQSFKMLRLKTQSFLKSNQTLVARHEAKYMQVEDLMQAESQKSSQLLQAQREKLTKIQGDLKKEQEANRSKVDSLNHDKRLAQKDLKLRDEKITDLKRELLSVQRERIDKVETIKSLQSRLRVAEETEKTLKTQVDKFRTEAKTDRDELQWLKKEIDSMSDIVTSKTHQIKDLKEQVATLEDGEQSLRTQIEAKKRDLLIQTEQLSEKDSEIKRINSKVAKLQEDLQEQLTKVEQRMAVEAKQALDAQAKSKEANSKYHEVAAQLRKTQTSLVEAEQQVADYQAEISRLEARLNAQKGDNLEQSSSIQHLRGEVTDLNSKLDLLKSEYQKLEASKEGVQAELSEVSVSNAKSLEKAKEAEAKLARAEAKLQGLSTDISHQSTEIRQITSEYGRQNILIDNMVERLRLILLSEFGPKFDQDYLSLREKLPSRGAKSQILLFLLELVCFQLCNLKHRSQASHISITDFADVDLLRIDPGLVEAFKSFKSETLSIESASSLMNSLPVTPAEAQATRMMFVPYSKGIYIAFVLEDEQRILTWMKKKLQHKEVGHTLLNSQSYLSFKDYFSDLADANDDKLSLFSGEMSNFSEGERSRPTTPAVKPNKRELTNKLFLDVASCSGNMQKILNTFEMFVIAQVSDVDVHEVTPGSTSQFGLAASERFFLCKISKVEHIVNFKKKIAPSPNKDAPADYSFIDYTCV